MVWFHNRTAAIESAPQAANRTGDPARAEELLHRAQELRATGDLAGARNMAKEALDQSLRAHGERHPALVPFLLVYAGLLNQCQNWAAGKPFYERAQHLRGSVTPLR